MNNAKVRIYELSKELNLENKDIIEICEQLNIAVKSHSSTITESQAERIKASAEKYIATHAVSHSSESAKGERKQQILAIHHKQIRPMSPTDVLKAPNPSLAMPPRLPVKSQTTATITPMLTSHPIDDLSLEGESTIESRQGAIPSQPPEAPPQTPKTEETVAKETKLESPQLLNLPRKLSQKPAPGKVEPSLAAPNAQKAEDPAIGSVNLPTLVKGPKKVQKVGVVGANKPQTDEKKAKPELHRPHLPKLDLDDSIDVLELPMKPRAEESEGEEDESLTLGLKEKPKLKRLTPPRPSKRPKWEEEEEEEREKEAQNKAAKVAGKAKRRPNLLLDEEEEDLDADKETNLIPVSVSLSTARPLRSKSQTKAATAPTASKPKKAPVRAESGATRTRTERRDRKEVAQRPESVILSGSLTVRDLADLLNVPETEIIRNLFMKGIAVNVTQTLDFDTASLVAVELGVAVETVVTQAAATKVTEMIEAGDLQYLHHRPPVVTIMGHVDHGKTTLLDSIRKTKVAQGEAGGITQHIGAYHVDVVHQGRPEQIVFLDTPGHEAFTAMRARGARVTDIAVLVVAADDGVQPQTREAVSHARAAGVPIVVAINKVDKLEANPDRIKQELSELGLVPEEWGGQTIMVSVSALKGENLDTLLDMILLVAEVGELSANPDRVAKGTVIEAHLDRTRGPVATLLVQNGTLRVGDVIVAGSVLGKIRAMIDDRGAKVEAATPSFAVEVLGLNDVPAAGDEFDVFENEKEARSLAQDRTDERRQTRLQQAMSSRRVTLSTISAQAQEGELKELNLILKADVQGSVEAILGSLQQLPQNEVQIRVLLAAPGEVTETDVDLAAASGAVIVGFNTTLASGARHAADREGVDIREYDIIYKLLDDIQGAMEGLLDPEEIESSLGQVEVRAVFPVGKGSVAGCYVLSGKIVRNRQIRVRRGSNVIYEGVLDSLKRMKEDAREVNAGYECGIGVSKFHDWKEGDIIEVYEMTMKRRTLKQ